MPEITDGEAQDLMFGQFRETTKQTNRDIMKELGIEWR
jgi:hypothetical protein